MATHTQSGSSKIKPIMIRFIGTGYRLTWESLKKQMPAALQKMCNWSSATLKFISFDHGKSQVLNTCGRESYKLILQVRDKCLLATCNCGHKPSVCCDHIYGALRTIIWEFGEQYFERLQPNGAMQLAFQYGNYFDKKETKAGLNVSARPEIESVFKFNDRVTKYNLGAMLRLPVSPVVSPDPSSVKDRNYLGEEAIGYLLILPVVDRFLPFVLPVAGKLNTAKTGIKLFYEHLSGAKREYSHLLLEGQKKLNADCFDLWKRAESLSGFLFIDNGGKATVQKRLLVFTAWQQMMVYLAHEKLIYGYGLYRIEELKKGRPPKQRLMPVAIALEPPKIQFILADCGVFYQLTLQVLIAGEEIDDYTTEFSFFLLRKGTIYLFSSLKDAAIVQWMHHLEGQITIFKVHFAEFEKEVLHPIKQYYMVKEILKPKTERPLQL